MVKVIPIQYVRFLLATVCLLAGFTCLFLRDGKCFWRIFCVTTIISLRQGSQREAMAYYSRTMSYETATTVLLSGTVPRTSTGGKLLISDGTCLPYRVDSILVTEIRTAKAATVSLSVRLVRMVKWQMLRTYCKQGYSFILLPWFTVIAAWRVQ